ncbi:MAG: hypothetical protein CMJ44_03965 [Pimelobacter sp.]|nr:hypothetical protein [Pimelobacter sp.]
MAQSEWLAQRLDYVRGLKSPSDQQRLLLALAEMPERSATDERKLKALIRAEKAAERAQKAKADAARVVNAEKKEARKARDRELYQSAGLLILAGLVDTQTGKPTRDKGELLGALMALAESDVASEKRAEWKRRGDELLASREKPAGKKQSEDRREEGASVPQ